MYSLYSLLLTLGLVALLPRFLYDALRHGKYVAGLRQRLGQVPDLNPAGRPLIWLHCVSVGETQAARPLAEALIKEFPTHRLVVSTVTLTGQRVAREVFAGAAAAVIYFPFDWSWTVRRALRAISPSVVLIMETELWPNFLRECGRARIPVALVNGRLSEGSFRRYRLVRRFIARVLEDVSLALMQSEADAERIRGLGLEPARVVVAGNVKFDAGAVAGEQDLSRELDARFQFRGGRPLIVAASTHAPEERILLEAFKRLRATLGDDAARLLIAPRHPERFAETASLMDASGLEWTRRSSPPDGERDASSAVILLDTIGELRAVYPLASLVFVGGSIAPTGGHNVLEPASVGACVVTGAHTTNFEAIVRVFLEADALVQLPVLQERKAPSELARVFADLLADDAGRRAKGARARAVVEENRGASLRTVKMLAPLLVQSPEEKGLGQPQDARSDALSA